MSYVHLFESGEHSRNLGHFASLVNIASIHGEINKSEDKLLKRFAHKLGIHKDEIKKILKNPSKFPIIHRIQKKRDLNEYMIFSI